jgi:hypothetical protein
MRKDALDLISRLQAEIKVKNKLLDIAEAKFETIKAEAYKEFAEKLKKESYERIDLTAYVEVSDIDNLLKEMDGANND